MGGIMSSTAANADTPGNNPKIDRSSRTRPKDRPPTGCDVMEADLVAKRGFAGAGRPLNDIKAAFEEAATQNDIEAGDPTWHPLEVAAARLAHGRTASPCRGRITVNTEPPPSASSTLIVPPIALTS